MQTFFGSHTAFLLFASAGGRVRAYTRRFACSLVYSTLRAWCVGTVAFCILAPGCSCYHTCSLLMPSLVWFTFIRSRLWFHGSADLRRVWFFVHPSYSVPVRVALICRSTAICTERGSFCTLLSRCTVRAQRFSTLLSDGAFCLQYTRRVTPYVCVTVHLLPLL